MKKILLSILVSAFIMLIIPFIIVELSKPHGNASSTKPVPPTPTVNATEV